jgi:hypothetical protein
MHVFVINTILYKKGLGLLETVRALSTAGTGFLTIEHQIKNVCEKVSLIKLVHNTNRQSNKSSMYLELASR